MLHFPHIWWYASQCVVVSNTPLSHVGLYHVYYTIYIIPVAYQESCGCVCPIQLGMACIRNSWICTLHLCGFTILVDYIQRPLISSEMSFSTLFLWTSSCPFIYLLALHSQLHKKLLGGGGICSKANSKFFNLIPLVSVLPVSLAGILGGIIHRVPPFLVAVADPGEQFSMMWYRLLICGPNSEAPLYSPWGKCNIFANRTNLCDHSFAPQPTSAKSWNAIV